MPPSMITLFLRSTGFTIPGIDALITVGGDPGYWRYIEDGTVGAMIEARHGRTGFDAVRLCEKAIQNETIFVPRSDLSLECVTAKTLDDFRVNWIAWSTPPK